jgi:hypothetical protein
MLILLPGVVTAQLCEGGPRFTHGVFLVRADGLINSVNSTLSAGVGIGHRFVFGQFVAGRRFIAQGGGATTLISGRAGVEGSKGRLHVCPVVTVGKVIWPKPTDFYGDGYPFNVNEKDWSYGMAVGVVASTDKELSVVPTVSFTRLQATFDVTDAQSGSTENLNDDISVLDLGVGLVAHSGFSVRPRTLLPLGSGNHKQSYGVTVSFNF